jgi:hypothetical protein
LLGKQANITTIIQPTTGTNNNNANQGLKPASLNLLANIPKDGNNTTKENM